MRIGWKTIVLILVLLMLAIFVWQNLVAFTTPGELQVFVWPLEAPLGLVMLGILGAAALLFSILLGSSRASSMVEMRHYAKEIEAARKLADEAEASRVLALQDAIAGAFAEAEAAAEARHNILVAHLSQMDDRLGGAGGPDAPPPG